MGAPYNMAVALGIPTVSIFGPVDERIYGPYPNKGHTIVTYPIACRPCYRQFRRASCDHMFCLNKIEVQVVYEVVKKFLLAKLHKKDKIKNLSL